VSDLHHQRPCILDDCAICRNEDLADALDTALAEIRDAFVEALSPFAMRPNALVETAARAAKRWLA